MDASTNMLPVRFMFIVSAIGLLAALLSAGCASTQAASSGTSASAPADQPEVEITVRPWQKPVKLVTRTPSRERFTYVGKVRVVAIDKDAREFVDAARAADEKLREKARKLGADVVKLEVVSQNDKTHLITLAGRAYRAMY
jgi:hypothetical protein